MRKNRKIIVSAIVVGVLSLAIALAAAGALAATRALTEDRGKAVIDDAAAQLGVEPGALSEALKQALKNQVDQAVQAGRLTEEQGAALKERIDAREYPLVGGGPGFGHHGKGVKLESAASYLGLDADELREQLRTGTTLAEVAEAQGRTVAGLVDALLEDAKQKIAEAVDAGKLTQAQADVKLEGLEERITALVNGERQFGFRGGPNSRNGHGFRPFDLNG